MRCWNRGHAVFEDARVCGHCEAELAEAPSTEEVAAMMELLEQMPPDVLGELGEARAASTGAEEFANRIMVGPCPRCGSE